jgi:protease I
MKKIMMFFVMSSFIFAAGCKEESTQKTSEKTVEKSVEKPIQQVKTKKVGMFIAFNNFRDEEYQITKETLENAGILVETISISKGIAKGMIKITANVDKTVDETNPDDYDILVFIGGSGSLNDLDNEKIHNIVRKFYSTKNKIAAICLSPVILAHSGILEGKKATVWEGAKDELIKNKAIYTGKSVEIDSNIITANGPESAKEFAKKIIEII